MVSVSVGAAVACLVGKKVSVAGTLVAAGAGPQAVRRINNKSRKNLVFVIKTTK
jgi:hypothetical protein